MLVVQHGTALQPVLIKLQGNSLCLVNNKQDWERQQSLDHLRQQMCIAWLWVDALQSTMLDVLQVSESTCNLLKSWRVWVVQGQGAQQ
jgi:hypothetical protein